MDSDMLSGIWASFNLKNVLLNESARKVGAAASAIDYVMWNYPKVYGINQEFGLFDRKSQLIVSDGCAEAIKLNSFKCVYKRCFSKENLSCFIDALSSSDIRNIYAMQEVDES